MEFENKTQDLLFDKAKSNNSNFYKFSSEKSNGYMFELIYHDSLFISTADITFNKAVERILDAFEKPFIELIYVESGYICRCQRGYKNITLKPGMNIFVNNYKPMKMLYKPNEPLRFVAITLFADFYDKYINSKFPEENINIISALKYIPKTYTTPEIALIFKQLKSKMSSDVNNRIYYESKVGEIISILIEDSNRYKNKLIPSTASISKPDLKALTKICDILDNKYIERPTIDELAQFANMSPTKLKSTFKKVYGTSISQYSIQVKLRHSLILLSNNEGNIEDIALAIGYKNASKFSQVFYKNFGIYPKDYRNLFK